MPVSRRTLLMALAAPAAAPPHELFSRFVRVVRPQGTFPSALIRATPPSGEGWREVRDAGAGFRMLVPADARVEAARAGSRVVRVLLEPNAPRPSGSVAPALQVDHFAPAPGEPTSVDEEYVAEYVHRYPEEVFQGRLTVTDSGLVVLGRRLRLAMIGGTYPRPGGSGYRLQCVYLDRERQLFFTFDCAEADREALAATLARILLTLEVGGRK